MIVEWDELTDRYRHALVGAGAREAGPAPSLVSLVWTEWKRVYAPRNREPQMPGPSPDWQHWVDASRTRVRVEASGLGDVLECAAELLGPGIDKPSGSIASALKDRVAGHVALGHGVSIPHAPISGLPRSVAALVTTRTPVDVAGEQTDIFFVLLAPAEDPRQHLLALAHVARLCHDPVLLAGLRHARSADEAVKLLDVVTESAEPDAPRARSRRHALAVLEIESRAQLERVSQVVEEAFVRPVALAKGTFPFEALRTVLDVPAARTLLLLPIVESDEALLGTLLEEQSRVFPDELCRLHVLRHEVEPQSAAASPRPGV